jgi:hypothetical protein
VTRKRVPGLLIAMGLLLSVVGSSIQGQGTAAAQSKFVRVQNPRANHYIVVLAESILRAGLSPLPANGTPEQQEAALRQRNNLIAQRVRVKAAELAQAHRGRLGHVYDYVLQGFLVEFSETEALALSRNPEVKYVEEDAGTRGDQIISPGPIFNTGPISCSWRQSSPPWGLDRIDQRNPPMDGFYGPGCDSGNGVHAYVIDSGVRVTHTDFGGRATNDANFVSDGQNGNDCNGHGTHVAGIIGGSTYGVAKSVRIHSVKCWIEQSRLGVELHRRTPLGGIESHQAGCREYEHRGRCAVGVARHGRP